jgi:exopolyphosphatase/guanosine-5'-triphosphate,3'-diphosphate pyrophosphatase
VHPSADCGRPDRVAVVDIGTNSTRLLVAELAEGRVTTELERRTEVTRLGAGVDSGGALSPEATERVFATLEEYRTAIEGHDVGRAIAVLTSAVRDAANGEEFREAVQDRYGLEAHILSGEAEARLTFLGATSDRDPADDRPTLVIDIGGGSTELVIGSHGDVDFHVSTQAGVVRQSERHIHGDPPSAAELEAVAGDVRAIISEAVPESRRAAVQHAIAVAGTPTSLAAIAQRLDPYDPERVHGYLLGESERKRILARLAEMPRSERELVPGLHPARAPTILPGIVILGEVMALFGLREVEVSEHDILRGAALGL